MSQLLARSVHEALASYFRDLNGADPHGMHQMVMDAVEKPLLEAVLRQAGGNQSKAADWLGIHRNSLRRKMVQHGLTE
jgi:Fis family transcriptional regulator, factor for inversion stimulation protein